VLSHVFRSNFRRGDRHKATFIGLFDVETLQQLLRRPRAVRTRKLEGTTAAQEEETP
jgi:hypothetical protein